MAKQKTWNEKFLSSKPHQVKRLDKNFAGMKAGQQMLLPSPKLIDDFIQKIPEGEAMDIPYMRQTLAKQHQADVMCPIATGFVVKIVAEAAFEKLAEGESIENITPVWRVLDKDSPTLKKVSFDPAIVLNQRELEGI